MTNNEISSLKLTCTDHDGQALPLHCLGVDDNGRRCYAPYTGLEPNEPYCCDEDGLWMPLAADEIVSG
jgi:hypothetical protein